MGSEAVPPNARRPTEKGNTVQCRFHVRSKKVNKAASDTEKADSQRSDSWSAVEQEEEGLGAEAAGHKINKPQSCQVQRRERSLRSGDSKARISFQTAESPRCDLKRTCNIVYQLYLSKKKIQAFRISPQASRPVAGVERSLTRRPLLALVLPGVSPAPGFPPSVCMLLAHNTSRRGGRAQRSRPAAKVICLCEVRPVSGRPISTQIPVAPPPRGSTAALGGSESPESLLPAAAPVTAEPGWLLCHRDCADDIAERSGVCAVFIAEFPFRPTVAAPPPHPRPLCGSLSAGRGNLSYWRPWAEGGQAPAHTGDGWQPPPCPAFRDPCFPDGCCLV